MNPLKKNVHKILKGVVDHVMGNNLSQDSMEAKGDRCADREEAACARLAAAESCVLLKNNGVLPLDEKKEIAVFGRCQQDWFFVGYGSGGDVNPPYRVNFIDGLKNVNANYNQKLTARYKSFSENPATEVDNGYWGHWPMNYPEMDVPESLVKEAAATAEVGIVIIGRAAGEDRENTLTKGSYYLTDEEMDLLEKVTATFKETVVLMDIGNIIDMAWLEKFGDKISALMIVWQGGMESGNAVCDCLYGKVNPSGKLADTIAVSYEAYPSSANFGGKEFNNYAEGIFMGYRYFEKFAPEKILYPFGYGLSYTNFKYEMEGFEVEELRDPVSIKVSVKVTNTGNVAGKESVLLWCHQPEGKLEKAKRVLAGFGKTGVLDPGQSETLEISTDAKVFSSYDEGISAFVLEEGDYVFEAGEILAGTWTAPSTILIEQCERACTFDVDLRSRILERMPTEESLKAKTDAEVFELVSSLSVKELEALTRGHGMMNSDLGTEGNAGVFGGILESLREKGITPITCSDGPAGLRLKRYCALLPCGAGQACTFNTTLIEKLYGYVGDEMVRLNDDCFLGPGMNLHRNPLCGRNFEYFSEDPLVSGRMAAAVVRGIQGKGKASCPKHFACNNQENYRNTNDSRVNERTLRELYLRNFEICVKEGRPKTIMTSYNKVNGVWSHYNYDLVTTVLRKQWGFDGVVITDWWMRQSASPEFPELKDNAYRVRAQVDVLMPGDMSRIAKSYKPDKSLLATYDKPEGITRAELMRTAINVIKLEHYLHH
ncbi:MAG: glycoside hydrolase family 3 C-terminal domain-containing protein [Lachnospiraceae bacterium]|nr:glycoside hydrolase family 3 C-terminal domain-containing protein [Lachnospiraceae bacterium]